MSGSYNILRDTWIYLDIKQEAQNEMYQQYVDQQRLMLLTIVQARFPRLETLVRQLIEGKNEIELLQTLIIQIGTARLEKDVRQSISTLSEHNKLKGDPA